MRVNNFELADLIAQDDERESFMARDVSNSRDVIVHAVRSPIDGLPPKPSLVQLSESLFWTRRPLELLFAGEIEGRFYIVTESRTECRDIRNWLERQSQTNLASAESGGDMLGRAGLWKVPVKRVSPSVPTPEELPQNTPASDVSQNSQGSRSGQQPGAFTMMFAAVTPPREEHLQPDNVSAAPTVAAPQSQPGEFTMMFQTAKTSGTDPVSEPALTARSESIFPDTLVSASPYTPEEQAAGGSGSNWTQAAPLHKPSTPPVSPGIPAPAMDPDIVSGTVVAAQPATGMFKAHEQTKPLSPEQPAGPSEFTIAVAVPRRTAPSPQAGPPADSATPAAPSPVPDKPERPSYLPLILILNGLILAAMALIVYFVLKR